VIDQNQCPIHAEEIRTTMYEERSNQMPCQCVEYAIECSCGVARSVGSDCDSGPHNIRFTPEVPAWPVRVDMKNEPEHLPSGIRPALPESLLNGCVLAEVDDMVEDIAYVVPAAGDLVVALGFDPATPYVERVIVRCAGVHQVTAPLFSAHTVLPLAAVADQDSWWRDVTFGTVAVLGAVVDLDKTWVTTHPATAWDVEQLNVPPGSPVHVVYIRLTVTRADMVAAAVPGGLVLKLPAGRVNLGSPLPEHVSDRRVSDHAHAA